MASGSVRQSTRPDGEHRQREGTMAVILSSFWVGAVLFVVGCSGVQPSGADAFPPAIDEAPAPEPEEPRGVTASSFAPYFGEGASEVAAAALRKGDHGAARIAFLELARVTTDSEESALRARFVAAVCAHRANEHTDAVRELTVLAEQLPLLADHARYLAAVSAYRANEFESSIELANQVSSASSLRPDAELVAGDALRALGRHQEVEAHYRRYVLQRRGGPRLSEASYKLAESIERQLAGTGDTERLRDALRWYRRITYRYPRSQWATRASGRIAELAARLPEAERAGALKLSADEQHERAQAYARVHRHKSAMLEFRRTLELTNPDGPIGCQARLGLGRAAYNGRKREVAAKVLTETAAHCDDPDLRAWSLYLAARSHTSRNNDARAVELYTLLERDYPEHRLADDARLRRADAQLRRGKSEEFALLLRELPRSYPQGDMRCEGVWQLGWRRYREGQLEESLEILEEASELCDDPQEGSRGRELYWQGRILERLGRRADAMDRYEQTIRQSPLTYYMMMSARRLEALDAPRTRRVLRELMRVGEEVAEWRFDPDEIQRHPALLRGIELHRLGLARLAGVEFNSIQREDASTEELRWLIALLHHQVGDFPVSHTVARRELTGWRASYPVGDQRRYWLIAYPRGFEDLVRREARVEGVPPELLWAVMREESGFSPRIESYANAVGLLQLLPTTASRFARGLPANRAGLQRPENNVPIAARFLSWLLDRQDGSPLLAVASYNAGEGAVDRWRRRDPGLDLDEALESFTYDQTRRYTRRVLSSYSAYHFLYGNGRIPSLTGSGEPILLSTPTQ